MKYRTMIKNYFNGRVIFDHLPKTAGQAINAWLSNELGSSSVTTNLIGSHSTLIRRYGGDFSVISGHLIFHSEGLDPRYQYLTCFREPIDRAISWLFYVAKHQSGLVDLGDFWKEACRLLATDGEEIGTEFGRSITNPYVEHFASIYGPIPNTENAKLSAAISAIDQYDIWGLYEDLPGFMSDVSSLLGLQTPTRLPQVNVTKSRKAISEISPALQRRLQNLNELDLELYQILRVRWQQRQPQQMISLPSKGHWIPYNIIRNREFTSTEFSLLSAKIVGSTKVELDQVIVFELTFSLTTPVAQLEMGIHIIDEDGGRAFGTNTTLLKKGPMEAKAGTHCLQYHLVVNLPEGVYTAGFAFLARNAKENHELAWYDKLIDFSVTKHRRQTHVGYSSMPVVVTCTQIGSDVPQLVDDASGKIYVEGVLGSVAPNEVISLQVVLENTSTQTWGSLHMQSLALSYHWQDLNGDNILFEGERSPILTTFIPPDSTIKMVMRVRAPARPGDYQLILLPVQEGHGWFDQFGFTPTMITVHIEPYAKARRYLGNDSRLLTQCGKNEESTVATNGKEGFLIYGPYMQLSAGHYLARISLMIKTDLSGVWVDVSGLGGTQQFARTEAASKLNNNNEIVVPFELLGHCDDLEVRLWVIADSEIAVEALSIEPFDSLRTIENHIRPTIQEELSQEDIRIAMTASCTDCAVVPKVPNSGDVFNENGLLLQLMHDGTRVVAGGYCGAWMQRLIDQLNGHHEPQEELLFHTLLKHVHVGSLMVEFGCYWAYYSNWFLGAVPQSSVICIEPDENRLEIGRQNFILNQRQATFHMAAAGGEFREKQTFVRESDGASVLIPVWDFAKLLEQVGEGCIELLHMDTQGAELPFLQSIANTKYQGRLRFAVISTHHQCISGSATTHRDCLAAIIDMGAYILCEHSVDESYSGDGLIVASFHAEDANLVLPEISRNQPNKSLFGPDPKRSVKSAVVGSTAAPAHLKDLINQTELVQTADGPMHIFAADSVIGASLKTSGAFQTSKIDEVLGFLMQRFRFQPELFVDIGANIGTHIVHALKACGFTSGLAFEPDPYNHALLIKNIAENGLSDKARAFKLALSTSSGAATFELCGSNFGDHRVRVANVQTDVSFGEDQRRVISVLKDSGDDFLEENGLSLSAKTLMWVDTQGHEGHVFAGLNKHLTASKKPIIVCEFWPYGLERAIGKEMFFDFLGRCQVIYDISQNNWQDNPEFSLRWLNELYQTMLADTREGYYPHTDLLCIL